MKKILVLFAKDWDRLEFSRPEYRGTYEFIHEGFDLFRFPDNVRLLTFDVFAYINSLAQRFRRARIDGIVSNNEQFGAVVAAVLAEKLGLPGNDPRAVITAQHKFYARTHYARIATSCPSNSPASSNRSRRPTPCLPAGWTASRSSRATCRSGRSRNSSSSGWSSRSTT